MGDANPEELNMKPEVPEVAPPKPTPEPAASPDEVIVDTPPKKEVEGPPTNHISIQVGFIR